MCLKKERATNDKLEKLKETHETYHKNTTSKCVQQNKLRKRHTKWKTERHMYKNKY